MWDRARAEFSMSCVRMVILYKLFPVAAFPERDYFSVGLASLGDLGIEAQKFLPLLLKTPPEYAILIFPDTKSWNTNLYENQIVRLKILLLTCQVLDKTGD